MKSFSAHVGVDKSGQAVTLPYANASAARTDVAMATNGGSGVSCTMPTDWNAAKRKGYRIARVDVIEHPIPLDEARKQLQDKIDEIEADGRHHYKPALVQVNAPLALIQVELEARKQALKFALGVLSKIKVKQ